MFYFIRERNKLLARKSRLKVKSDLEGLKEKLLQLMAENASLKKQIATAEVPPLSAAELINSEFQLPENIQELVRQLISRTEKAVSSRQMRQSSFCISNAISPDLPLVYASPGFLTLTGYSASEIVGRNCRFLQGAGTDQREIVRMKRALEEGRDVTAVLLNYRKDGRPFWNQVKLAHLKDQTGRTFLVVGIQTKLRPLHKTLALPKTPSLPNPVHPSEGDGDKIDEDDDEEEILPGDEAPPAFHIEYTLPPLTANLDLILPQMQPLSSSSSSSNVHNVSSSSSRAQLGGVSVLAQHTICESAETRRHAAQRLLQDLDLGTFDFDGAYASASTAIAPGAEAERFDSNQRAYDNSSSSSENSTSDRRNSKANKSNSYNNHDSSNYSHSNSESELGDDG